MVAQIEPEARATRPFRWVAVSLRSGEVSAHEATRMISRDGNATSPGQAIARCGRIFKTLHILRLADDEPSPGLTRSVRPGERPGDAYLSPQSLVRAREAVVKRW
ncbi:Tn3 family transposase [Actinomadura viridis]|uniref:Tn3 family transposase n=1 Tax=Actinomadura viridis TaxID=58110 RepID=UPI0036B9420A